MAGERDQDGNVRVRADVGIYEGPLPHPDMMARYDPATREAIVKSWQDETRHRRALEVRLVTQDETAQRDEMAITKLGMQFGLTIGLAGLAASLVAVALGGHVVGGVIAGLDLVAMMSVFARRHAKRNETPTPAPSPPTKGDELAPPKRKR